MFTVPTREDKNREVPVGSSRPQTQSWSGIGRPQWRMDSKPKFPPPGQVLVQGRKLFREAAFDPEVVKTLCLAYGCVIRRMYDADQPDSVQEVIASALFRWLAKAKTTRTVFAPVHLRASNLIRLIEA